MNRCSIVFVMWTSRIIGLDLIAEKYCFVYHIKSVAKLHNIID